MPLRLAVLVTALVLVGCSGDDSGPSDPIALDAAPDGTADDTETADTADDAGVDDGGRTPPHGDVVDASVAEPGTWQVGDAGTVTFSVSGDRLVLDDVTPSQGWTLEEVAADGDDIEVELARTDDTATFEVDLEGDATRLEVHIGRDLEGAAPGTFELGAAGSVTVSIEGDRLVVDELTVADGWQESERDEGGDEVELDLVRGDQRWRIEIELDDDRLDVALDYEVSGQR